MKDGKIEKDEIIFIVAFLLDVIGCLLVGAGLTLTLWDITKGLS